MVIRLSDKEIQSVQDRLEEGYTIKDDLNEPDEINIGKKSKNKNKVVTKYYLYSPEGALLMTYLLTSRQASQESRLGITIDDSKNCMVFHQAMQEVVQNHRERYKLIVLRGNDGNISDSILIKKGNTFAIVPEDLARRDSEAQYEFEQTEVDIITNNGDLRAINFNNIEQISVG